MHALNAFVKYLVALYLLQVEARCDATQVNTAESVLEFLQQTTMVGLLPVPHPIVIRNYFPNVYTDLWFNSYLWGVLLSESEAFHTQGAADVSKVKLLAVVI